MVVGMCDCLMVAGTCFCLMVVDTFVLFNRRKILRIEQRNESALGLTAALPVRLAWILMLL